MNKLDVMLVILNDTLPIPDWKPEPYAATDLLDHNVTADRVHCWLELKGRHTCQMILGMRDRRS